MDYNHPCLYAFLAEQIARECINLTSQNCSACKENLRSPLLHYHCHLNLLESLRQYFEEVRANLLANLSKFYNCIESKLPHSPDKKKDQMLYILNAQAFLSSCNPETIYWGRYVSRDDDGYIFDSLKNLLISQ